MLKYLLKNVKIYIFASAKVNRLKKWKQKTQRK